jgi:hypothetical protein
MNSTNLSIQQERKIQSKLADMILPDVWPYHPFLSLDLLLMPPPIAQSLSQLVLSTLLHDIFFHPPYQSLYIASFSNPPKLLSILFSPILLSLPLIPPFSSLQYSYPASYSSILFSPILLL